MKKGFTYVTATKLTAICAEAGANLEQQAGFIKVTGSHPSRAMYIGKGAKAKDNALVSTVHISGFTHDAGTAWAEVYPDKGQPTKRVEQVIDFRKDEPAILAAFEACLIDGLFAEVAPAAPAPAPAPEVQPELKEAAAS
jgi:hypothetical protein